MRLAVALLACVVGLGAQTSALPQSPKTGTASITGRVITADTGAVVRAAVVWLMTPVDEWTTTSDPDGRFLFPHLPAGSYTLKVRKPGFVATEFGDPKSSAFGGVDPIQVTDGLKVNRGDLALPRGGVIAGRIVDGYGDPVDITVQVLRRHYVEPGVPRLSVFGGARTNDLGEFRIFGLMPGTYYLAAGLEIAPRGVTNPAQGEPRLVASRFGIAPTLYPGTATAADAWAIKITPGQDVSGISMTLQSVPLAHVSGTVTTSSGSPAAGFTVMANPIRRDRVDFFIWNYARTDANGHFTIADLPPGEYQLDVQSGARLNLTASKEGDSTLVFDSKVASESASAAVSVAGQNIEGLAVRTTAGYEVQGRIVTEDNVPLPSNSGGLVVSTAPPMSSGFAGIVQQASGTAGPDGRFVVKSLGGPQRVSIVSLPNGWAVKRITAPVGDITDEGLDVRGEIRGVEILITSKLTRVSGKVGDAQGLPVRESAAVIFSTDARRWTIPATRYIRLAPTLPSGEFIITGLPPGDYFAAAIGRVDDGTWADPDFLERVKAIATQFTLTDGESKTLTLVRKK